MKNLLSAAALAFSAAATIGAQRAPYAPANFIKIESPVIVLTHVRVVDGTGAAPRENQTIVLRDGKIADIGDSGRVPDPGGPTVFDLTGKTVIPGLVMVHEHLYYPTGPAIYAQLGESFTRLYLAGGVTTMRTGGRILITVVAGSRTASAEPGRVTTTGS